MNRIIAIVMIAILVLAAGCVKQAPMPKEITFVRDFETAKAEAVKTNKPMIIDFYTEWCKWCHTLDTVTYVDSIVIAMSKDNIFVKIDAEADSALADKYAISGYPTIIIAKPDGQEIDRIWGYLGPNEFYNQVQLYLQGKETLEDYLARLQDEPFNPEYLMTIGEKYAGRSETQKAVEYFAKVVSLDADNIRGLGARALAATHDTQSRAHDYKAAIATCQDLITRFPNASQADDAAAMIAYYTAKSGDEAGALVLYREYLQKYPKGENYSWVQNRVADLEEKL